jgi:hypothetical protein
MMKSSWSQVKFFFEQISELLLKSTFLSKLLLGLFTQKIFQNFSPEAGMSHVMVLITDSSVIARPKFKTINQFQNFEIDLHYQIASKHFYSQKSLKFFSRSGHVLGYGHGCDYR